MYYVIIFSCILYLISFFFILGEIIQDKGSIALLFDEMQNVNVNVILLISTCRLTNTTQNNWVQDLHYVLRFVKVKQQFTAYLIPILGMSYLWKYFEIPNTYCTFKVGKMILLNALFLRYTTQKHWNLDSDIFSLSNNISRNVIFMNVLSNMWNT